MGTANIVPGDAVFMWNTNSSITQNGGEMGTEFREIGQKRQVVKSGVRALWIKENAATVANYNEENDNFHCLTMGNNGVILILRIH
jgi:hypothetical protein